MATRVHVTTETLSTGVDKVNVLSGLTATGGSIFEPFEPVFTINTAGNRPVAINTNFTGIGFDIAITDESLAAGYPARQGSIGNGAGEFSIKYGSGDADWGIGLYLNNQGHPQQLLNYFNNNSINFNSLGTNTLAISGNVTGINNRQTSFNQGSATGNYSFAANQGGAYNTYSFAEGNTTVANGSATHAEGFNTTATGNYSHAEGQNTATGQKNPILTYTQTTRVFTFSPTVTANFNYVLPGSVLRGFVTSIGYFTVVVQARSTTTGNITATNNVIGSNLTSSSGAILFDNFGIGSHAEGYGTIASGSYSHAEGGNVIASGNYSHAEGLSTVALSYTSHAEGQESLAFGIGSHAEGYSTLASARYSHAEGESTVIGKKLEYLTYTQATKTFTFAPEITGYFDNTQPGDMLCGRTGGTSSLFAFTVQSRNQFTGDIISIIDVLKQDDSYGYIIDPYEWGYYAHAEGSNTTASGDYSHAEGQATIASGLGSHAEGNQTTASGDYSHAEGYITFATNFHSHSEGIGTVASGEASHAGGYNGIYDGVFQNITASGKGSFAHGALQNSNSGAGILASGEGAFAGGFSDGNVGLNSLIVEASGIGAFAYGYQVQALGNFSHAEGQATIASGLGSHAEGYLTEAKGLLSHAAGCATTAAQDYTYIWSDSNKGTITQNISTTRSGQYMVSASGGMFIPGNMSIGTDDNTNALTVIGNVSATKFYGDGSNLTNINFVLSSSTVTLSTVTLNPIAALSGANFITSRVLQDKFGEIISVKDFGAKGNGLVDDWLPIQRALSAAAGIAKVYIPQGLYYIKEELKIPSNSYIYGAGIGTSVIKLSSSANATQCVMTNSQNTRSVATNQGNENIVIKDLELDGNVSRFPGSYSPVGDTSGTGLCFAYVKNALVERVAVHDTCRHCFDICAPETSVTFNPLDYTPNPSFNVHLKDIIAYGAGDDNITTHFSHSIIIENPYVPYTGGTEVPTNSNGIEIDDGSYDITIIGGYIKNCRRGLEVKGHSWAPAAKRVKVYGLTCENNTRNFGIRHLGFDSTDSKTAFDVALYDCTSIAPVSSTATTDTPRSLQISNYDGVFVKDFKVVGEHNASRAITIQERARNVNFDGVTFTQISGAITGITDAMLYIDSTASRNITIRNAIFRDCIGLPIAAIGSIPGVIIDGVDASTSLSANPPARVIDFSWSPLDTPYIIRNVTMTGYSSAYQLGGSHDFDFPTTVDISRITNIIPASPATANTQYTVARFGWREGTGQSLNAGLGTRIEFTGNLVSGVSANTDLPVAYIGTRKVNGTDSDVTSNLTFGTLSANNSTAVDRLTITPTGNVGINTTTPNERLTVVGNISATGIIYTNNDIEITDFTKGIILRSPNGNRWRTTITDSGTLLSVQL